MIARQIEPAEGRRGPARFRYLVDIIVLVAVTFLLDAFLGAFVQVPIDLEKGFVLDAIVKVLLVGVGCGLVLLRGEKLADIGLKKPENWTRTLIIGVGFAAIVFAAIYLSERAGFRRDISKFKDVHGNPKIAFVAVFYALIGAGFYEEFTFRGFLMQSLAMLFGGSRGAWIGACVLQGALFGAAHAYQNPLGIAITGTLGILMGLLVLALGRNLWAVIIGHGLFDASRFVLFYFKGPPTG
jgi:membrane protease YdiL (CAAX protease family)